MDIKLLSLRKIFYSTGERKRRPRGDRKSMEMSQHLKQTFEATIKVGLFPRSQIDIFVEVLQVNLDLPVIINESHFILSHL